MFYSLFRSPIEIKLNDRVLRFESEADFAFAIEGRSDVCGEDSARLMASSDETLAMEITRLEAEEASLRSHFEDAFPSAEDLSERLAQVDPSRWRTEHQWDEILCALALTTSPAHAIKRNAVATYLNYLRTRRSVAVAVLSQRTEGQPNSDAADSDATLSSNLVTKGNSRDQPLNRGQARVVLDTDRSSVLVRFAQHHHRLTRTRSSGASNEETIELTDDGGMRWRIPPGLSSLGRDRGCDIALRPILKDISRAHAIVNLDESGRVWITDTSSQGTFIVDEDDAENGA